jgi:amidohydrolase
MKDRIKELAKSVEAEVIAHRNHFHTYPEVSFKEVETSAYIKAELDKYGIQYKAVSTSVIGRVKGQKAGKTVAFRADIDALAMQEKSDSPYRSKNDGVMHACGHDAHMAIVLGLAKALSCCVDELSGVFKFIFQPGEEANGGARCMIDAGVLENPAVDAIFALHMVPDLPSGTIGVRSGYMTATDDEFIIRVKGMSTHSSTPQEGVNAVLIAAHIITALQSIMSTQISPFDIATFSVCSMKGGEAENVIPDYAEMTGMLRCVEKQNKLILRESMQKICINTGLAMGGSAEAEFTEGFPAVYNDEKHTEILAESAAAVLGEAAVIRIQQPHMGSEDFSYYQEQIPGVIFMLGSKPKEGHTGSLHSPTFNICEDSLLTGVKVFASLAFDLCAKDAAN